MVEYIKVRVGQGKRIHLMSQGSSVTLCGEWTGTSHIWRVDDSTKVTCKHCGGDGDELPKTSTPVSSSLSKDELEGVVIRHPEHGLGVVQKNYRNIYRYHPVAFKNFDILMSDSEIIKYTP